MYTIYKMAKSAWRNFLTNYHNKSKNKKFSKSMKEAGVLWRKQNKKGGAMIGGDDFVPSGPDTTLNSTMLGGKRGRRSRRKRGKKCKTRKQRR